MYKFMSHLNSYVIVACYIAPPPLSLRSRYSIFVLPSLELNNCTSVAHKDNSPGLLQVFKQYKGPLPTIDRYINFKRSL